MYLTESQAKALKEWADEQDRPNGCSGWGPKFDAAMAVAREVSAGLTDAANPINYVDAINGFFFFSRCCWPIARAETELEAFVYQGPGWYKSGDDTLLVLPVAAADSLSWFIVWNGSQPIEALKQALSLPVHD